MIKKLLFIFLLIPYILSADTIYVDQTLVSDCTTGNYSIANRNCAGSDGDAYNTIEDAFDNMVTGDTVYLRGGTYTENFGGTYTAIELPLAANGTAWTEGNFSTVSSYPGEWAIMDASGNSKLCAFGHCDSGNGGASDLRTYWVIERIEIKGGSGGGLGIWEGPVKVRYNYIHSNATATQDDNPSGFRSYRLKSSEIKYNLFDDNGTTGSVTHNAGHIAVFTGYYLDGGGRESFDFDNATHSNEFAYNYFLNTNDYAGIAIKQKARQYLGATLTDTTYEDYGDKVHHNIMVGDYLEPVMLRMDFQQIYKNIGTSDGVTTTRVWNSNSTASGTESSRNIYQTWYNNTVIDACVSFNEGYDGVVTPIIQTNTVLNNIINSFSSDFEGRGFRALSFYRQVDGLDPSEITYTAAIDNNLFRDITNTDEINWGSDNVADRDRTVAEFNSAYTVDNYATDAADLFLGATGADRLITDGDFVVTGVTTISDGGSGGSHPYLSGITFPDYVGATNPDDNAWVAGVLDMDVSYFTDQENGSDPSWIEGAASRSSEMGAGTSSVMGAGTSSVWSAN